MNLPFNEPSSGRARCPQRAGWMFDKVGGALGTDAPYPSRPSAPGGSAEAHPGRRAERGSATILVFALLAVMVLYMNSNQLALHSLKRDLRLFEQKQLKKFQPPAKAAPPVQP